MFGREEEGKIKFVLRETRTILTDAHLSRGSSWADPDGVPPPGVCLSGFAGIVEVLGLPFFKDMGHCCGNSSPGKHVSIFVETWVLYEEIVSVVLLW